MGRSAFWRIAPFVAAAAAWGILGCSKPDVRQDVVASADGESIRVFEVREILGQRGGTIALSGVPADKKKEALERAIAIRLLALEARRKGLDNTEEFRSVVDQNARGVLIGALFRREVAARLKVSEDDVKTQAKKLRDSDKTLTEEQASGQARRLATEDSLRRIEEDLIAAARKEFPVSVNQDLVEKIGKGEKVPDDAVLGTAGGEKIAFSETRRLLAAMSAGAHGDSKDLSRNAAAIGRLLDREVTGMALASLARKKGAEGSEEAKVVRAELERSVLVNILAEREILKDVSVTDKEIAAAYAEHAQMFVRAGKKIALKEVKPQIRDFLMNDKRRKAIDAYVAELRKKAKVTVNEEALVKV